MTITTLAMMNALTSKPTDGHSRIFIALCYEWMRPYVIAALKALWTEGSQLIVALEDERRRADFDFLPADAVHFHIYPKGWFAGKIFAMHPIEVTREIDRLVASTEAEAVVSLSMDLPLSFYLPRLAKRVPVVSFVHDVRPHERHYSSLRKRIFYLFWHKMPLNRMVRLLPLQITNARWQKDWLEKKYPNHKVQLVDFPGLVDTTTAEGTAIPPELDDKRDYVLFFGKLEHYKGVDRLIEAWKGCSELHGYQLVIAGSGAPDFEIPDHLKGNILLINRYIDDEEVAELFRRAAAVVYPYRAATQSGVVSLATYFGRPVVMSDITYFAEIADWGEGLYLVDASKPNKLGHTIIKAVVEKKDTRPIFDAHYDSTQWADRARAALAALLP